jgi:hypothetical protein
MGMHFDEGLDRHEWDTRWQEYEPLLADTPGEALPEIVAILIDLARERGYAIDGDVAATDVEEPIKALHELRETATRLSSLDQDVPDDEVAEAAEMARELYGYLIDDRRDWGPAHDDVEPEA